MSWKVTANDIKIWSEKNSRKAQELLPKLIKKLILATVEPKYLSFPSCDSILTGGIDGILEVKKGNSFVPDGTSYWEFGTNKSIHCKAEDDYLKRTEEKADKDITYIFATTQTWMKKESFIEEKNKENKWKDVRGINADDLESWLDLSPAVHRWFSRVIEKRPKNALDIEEAFDRWSNQTQIKLSENLVLISRDEEKKKLLNLLNHNTNKIVIVSQSEEESYIFAISALKDDIKYSSRVLIVHSQIEWDNLIQSQNSLILIPQKFTPENIGQAINNGHFVIEPQESINIQNNSNNQIELKKVWKEQKEEILENMGLDREKVYELLSDTKGFIHAISKHKFLKPYESKIPSWLKEYDINILSSILFINSWSRNNEFDKKILEYLSELPYLEFEKNLHLLAKEKENPIRLVGEVWQVISKLDLWDLLAKHLSISQIDKLEKVLIDVLGEIDPKFKIEPSKRWYEFDKKLSYSGLIRESIADTICLISVFGDKSLNYSKNINSTISNWLNTLYNRNLNVEAWYSYHNQLGLLAEASPDSFLTALEKIINNPNNQIEKLFENEDDILGSCNHCELLWTLEKISWSEEYIVRVVLILAKLSKMKVKDNLSNRPFNSLIDIFLGWVNHSSLTHSERIEVLENILLKQNFETTWKLLIELLPDNHSFSSGIAKPKYNSWDEKSSKSILNIDYYNYIKEISRLLLTNANSNIDKWFDIFKNINKFNKDYYFKAVDEFYNLDKSIFSKNDKLKFSTTLRDTIHRHREFADTEWAMDSEWINKLEEAFYFIEPENLIFKYKYLFDEYSPKILNPKPVNDNFDENEKEYQELRIQAIEEILDRKGFNSLIELIKVTEHIYLISNTLIELNINNYDKEIFNWIKSGDEKLVNFAKMYISSLYYKDKITIDENFLNSYSDEEVVKVLLSLGFGAKVFELIKKSNEKVQEHYWTNINSYIATSDEDIKYIDWIVSELLKYNRPMKVINLFSLMLHNVKISNQISIDLNLIHQSLIEVVTTNHKDIDNLDHYQLSKVLRYYQKHSSDIDKKMSLEWIYANFDDFKPLTIESKVIENPKDFVELVSYVYKPKHSDRESNGLTDEQIRNRANNSRKILKKLSLFSEHIQDKSLNSNYLKEWIVKAQELFKKVDRVGIGDDQIGQALSKSPKGEDGIWPHEAIREVLEVILNEKIETAFLIGKQNQRGIVWRDKGGKQEYELARGYREDAKKLKFTFPKTFYLLNKLAKWYEEDGKREDLNEELR